MAVVAPRTIKPGRFVMIGERERKVQAGGVCVEKERGCVEKERELFFEKKYNIEAPPRGEPETVHALPTKSSVKYYHETKATPKELKHREGQQGGGIWPKKVTLSL